ncbi:hypothetical protein RhiirC2_778722 [Rhizophagus irregularis]|uniref:Uncharacterized protein n=1 Tax=Rhizophagus irregularis TaxID=588596 RepID=A0A2N1NBI7_9GLOM|nr:hypothetical protein RhiirC2_778722 [Rhizophagus irregularis]
MFTGLLERHYLDEIVDYKIVNKLTYASTIISFYVPNILQTLLITLFWPINFYFVKACVFIPVLPLTRNVSYFADKVPGELPATSTTITQCLIRFIIKNDFKKSLRRLKYQ